MAAAGPGPADLFAAAEREVFQMLLHGAVARFVAGAHFARFACEAVEGAGGAPADA